MAEVSVTKKALRVVAAWEAAVHGRLAVKPPPRHDDRVLLGPTSSPERLRDGILVVGTGSVSSGGVRDHGDGERLNRLGRSTGMFRSRNWPEGKEVGELQRLALRLTEELSAGAGRPYSHEPDDPDRRKLANAVGRAVGRFHSQYVVEELQATKVISADAADAFRKNNDFAQATPNERLVDAFAGHLDPTERRNLADGRLLDRMHASPQPDKARVAAEILVNRSPVLGAADDATRARATDYLSKTIHEQLGRAIDELDESRERDGLERRADTLGRRIGEDVGRAIARLEQQAAPAQAADRTAELAARAQAEPGGEAAAQAEAGRGAGAEAGGGAGAAAGAGAAGAQTGTGAGADGAAASRLAGDGVAGAREAAKAPAEVGTTAAVPPQTVQDRKATQGKTIA
ncbi:hypothetical protein [Kribbella sp. NPDC004536]|uniref:hypothetical protein n=1 Tax=Kribbella sp. NPDC004536 TaxID=3364106 RepID=UPI003681125D